MARSCVRKHLRTLDLLRALGGLGSRYNEESENWKRTPCPGARINRFVQTKSDWQNVCIVANSVVSNRQARAATKAFIKNQLGLPLSEAEAKSIAHGVALDAASLLAATTAAQQLGNRGAGMSRFPWKGSYRAVPPSIHAALKAIGADLVIVSRSRKSPFR